MKQEMDMYNNLDIRNYMKYRSLIGEMKDIREKSTNCRAKVN